MNYESRIDASGDPRGNPQDMANPLDSSGEEDGRSRRRPYIYILIAAVLLIGLWFLLHGGGADGPADKKNQAPVVSVIAPGSATIEGVINATGTLAARRELPVGSVGEGGQVREVLVEAGDWVRQGQVLAVIDRSGSSPNGWSVSASRTLTPARCSPSLEARSRPSAFLSCPAVGPV